MEKILKIAELLGEENAQKLKDGIADLLLDVMRSDLDDMEDYFINFECLFDEIREEVFKNVKEKMIKRYTREIETRFEELFENRKENT